MHCSNSVFGILSAIKSDIFKYLDFSHHLEVSCGVPALDFQLRTQMVFANCELDCFSVNIDVL